MSTRPLVILPAPQLRLTSAPIARVDDGVRKLAEDMLETMYAAPGIGLAAVQVGEMTRLITIDVSHDEDVKEPRVFINPEILWKSEDLSVYEEGCLSIPEFYEEVERPARVRVRYTNLAGEPEELEADGLLSTCLQHEIDHLEGVLFIDHISRLKRERVTKKFIKASKEKARI
ncbi:peptide deformylase [Pleomorphomonas sp. PLEO]|uniref:peptide deformylase n=1 Tax=Pleomorphomonas sp. PLEO TaxID=3239306 RepID=UPI00351E10D2